MKSTGAGARGGLRRVILISSGRRFPLRMLQGAHEVTTFSQTESPPRLRGTTWSRVSLPAVVPQYMQRQGYPHVLDEPDHVRSRESDGRRSEGLVELLDHLCLALEHEHVRTPNG